MRPRRHARTAEKQDSEEPCFEEHPISQGRGADRYLTLMCRTGDGTLTRAPEHIMAVGASSPSSIQMERIMSNIRSTRFVASLAALLLLAASGAAMAQGEQQ